MTEQESTALAAGLRGLAAMVEQQPHVADEHNLQWQFEKINVPVFTKNEVVAFARAGKASGAKVTKHQGDKYAGVDVTFGAVSLHVYVDRAVICERIVTGTTEVTKEVPDPAALAAVPKVTVTNTVETVEWRCVPLLADEVAAAEVAAAALTPDALPDYVQGVHVGSRAER